MSDVARVHSRTPWYRILYVQVLVAIVLGAGIGWGFPETGAPQ